MKTEIIERKVSELNKLENNPRWISKEDFGILKNSMIKNPKFLWARPLILSNRTGKIVVIGGNQRLAVATELGWEKIPTILLVGFTEEEEKDFVLTDNINNGSWDWDLLANGEFGTEDELSMKGLFIPDLEEPEPEKPEKEKVEKTTAVIELIYDKSKAIEVEKDLMAIARRHSLDEDDYSGAVLQLINFFKEKTK